LYDYATDKIFRHGYDKKAGDILITQDVNSFYESPDGTAWVGTWQGGLSEYNVETKKIKTFTREDGLPSMSIQSIIADEQKNTLWLSTFDGLSRFDLKTKQFNNFSIIDGIQGQLFADGSYLKTSDGSFVFGGSNGITIFDPATMNKNSAPPKVFLTDLKLFDRSVIPGERSVLKKPIYDTKEIELSHDQNNISIEFLAIHYTNPSKNKYAYKLDNYDNDWREVGNQHTAFYPTLAPGKYIFHVKAANNNGVWNEEGATLIIIIDPPWWKTIWAYIFYGLLLIAFIAISNRYLRQRLVEKERAKNQARELTQAREIEKAYNELKITQAQLIQAEKMASLGELTAGIAHEIQNPLNFVNNFSEVNKELLAEMNVEIDKENFGEVKAIAKDVIENEEKINHHGKRADAIVKGMLQHSRSSTSQKEPTDINALADEYLRLSYHGLRAKDNSFNATMKTDFDESIGKINIIPQDIGRVLLNLYNNAFYAVNEKTKNADENYQPSVSVQTKKINDKAVLTVMDNGNGIPQKVVDKIFQPFFTTKPTGQGTGLGLSLSYDIIKAHSGEIKVNTKENEGSEFIIELPLK
jgi:signal transduction histidine kinase